MICHTNLDNVSIAGMTTMSGNLRLESTYPRIYLKDTNNNPDFSILQTMLENLGLSDDTNTEYRLQVLGTGKTRVYHNLIVDKDLDVDGHTNLDNGIVGVTTYNRYFRLISIQILLIQRFSSCEQANTCEIEGRKVGGENNSSIKFKIIALITSAISSTAS